MRLGQGQSIDIPLCGIHRLSNPGQTVLEVIDAQLGEDLCEYVIARLEDD